MLTYKWRKAHKARGWLPHNEALSDLLMSKVPPRVGPIGAGARGGPWRTVGDRGGPWRTEGDRGGGRGGPWGAVEDRGGPWGTVAS